MPKQQPWTRDELLLAMNLYCRLPFGKMHKGNPEIITLSKAIGRTPSSVAMKLVNLASLDPAAHAVGRGVPARFQLLDDRFVGTIRCALEASTGTE